ncbi:DUF4238 domain-containing protein [Pseudarthrobacter oxydans]|uniref:DUF4238 domain-containing protein n=1 Tax=Pseudarthrobacter oxydans TaxID=1671 RepID=UPI0027D83103|nr:DUF4238 domain-containing protein [Pseudarthrobacter oxydans]
MPKPGTTNDHIVPVMYLKRFARQSANHQVIQAAIAETPAADFTQSIRNVGSSKGFYWGTDPDGVPHHHMEQFLGIIEGEAAPAFRYILDKGSHPADNVLPHNWPSRADVRHAIAWWMAAQILRTARQRERLNNLKTESLSLPRGLARNNHHLEYIAKQIAPLAFLLTTRPWGIGFTNLCLYTSDVPVQIINGQDDNDQLKAASYWDIYLPLDPHRFLYLPGSMHRDQPRLMRDHTINLPGGLAMALNDLMIENAHRHVFFHPEHDPRAKMHAKLIADAVKRRGGSPSESVLYYDAMPPGTGIERRWLERHTWDDPNLAKEVAAAGDPTEHVERMTERLMAAKDAYRGI